MTFAALDVRTHFSVGESLLTPSEAVEQGVKLGWKAMALCDTMSVSGAPEFYEAAAKHGVKPILGCRLRVVPDLEREKKQFTVFPKLYVLSEAGYAALLALLTTANDDIHFHYKARLTWNDVEAALLSVGNDDLALSFGTLYSALRDANSVSTLSRISAKRRVYAEVCPISTMAWRAVTREAISAAVNFGIEPIASRPILYSPGQSETLGVMAAIASNLKRSGAEFEAAVTDYHWKSPGEFISAINIEASKGDAPFWKRAATNISALSNLVTFNMTKQPPSLPKMAVDENTELLKLALDGLKNRIINPTFSHKISLPEVKVYGERLNYELGVLKRLNFAGYFLLTSEIVQWAKSNGIYVGPGRGSVGGSLVAYAIGITEVDPIRFNLLFERFINPDRIDLPDADLDFMSMRRHEVISHIVDTYGEDKVAGVTNYTTMASGSALRDVGRIFGLDMAELEVSKFIPSIHGKPLSLEEARKAVSALSTFSAKRPQVWQHALSLEGRMRSLGRHAAGIVIAGEPLIKRAVVERRNGEPTVNWDKDSAEGRGLVKMDILGLSTLDMLALATDHIFKRHGVKVDLNRIPLDEPDVLDAFRRGETTGVFQFESTGSKKILRDVGKEEALRFEDVAAITALNRPGPMDSGLLEDFVAIKQGLLAPSYPHPLTEATLSETYGVITYQEQVQRIAVDLCGFSLPKSDHLRKAIGKKLADKMAGFKTEFIEGAVKNGMAQHAAEKLWGQIEKFGAYGFNKSHSIAYTLLSYQAMWLKVKYPVEFFAAAIQIADDDKRLALLRAAKASGISVLPPDLNNSTGRFEILNDTTLVAPFSVVKGISQNAETAIVEERAKNGPFKDVADLQSRVPARRCNSAVVSRLDAIGAFARVTPGAKPADDPERKAAQIEFAPSIVLGGAFITRSMPRGSKTIGVIDSITDEMTTMIPRFDSQPLIRPFLGKGASFMVITDGPTWAEEESGSFAKGKTFDYIETALKENGLARSDGYWTGLCKHKKPKGVQLYPPSEIAEQLPYLKREIEALKPQAIILLGGAAIRTFATLKGNPADHIGKVIYQKESAAGANDDINWIIGFNPAMIAFDWNKQAQLNGVFKIVAEMLP